MDGAKPTKSPCPSGSKLSKLYGELLLDPTVYRHVMGALQLILSPYLARNFILSVVTKLILDLSTTLSQSTLLVHAFSFNYTMGSCKESVGVP
jgi:hypothetical protein